MKQYTKKCTIPQSLERWQQLALDPKRHVEAAQAYRALYQNATLVEAARKVRLFHQTYHRT